MNPENQNPEPQFQTAVSSPIITKNRSLFLWLIGGLVVLALGIAVGLFSAKFLNQSQTQSQLPPTPALVPSSSATPAQEADPTADWETYTNSKYSLSFKHPNFDDKCCGLAGAVVNSPTSIVTLADKTTVRPNSDAPFDGITVYIVSNEENLSLDQYIEKEKLALYDQFKTMADSNQPHLGQVSESLIAGQRAIVLTNYSWDGITRTYFMHTNKKIIIEISKKEQSPNHFSYYDQILSTFKFTD